MRFGQMVIALVKCQIKKFFFQVNAAKGIFPTGISDVGNAAAFLAQNVIFTKTTLGDVIRVATGHVPNARIRCGQFRQMIIVQIRTWSSGTISVIDPVTFGENKPVTLI